MRCLVLGIPYGLAILRPQLRILDRDCLIDRWVTRNIRCVVRQRAQREGVLVDIPALKYQLANKVSAANAMHQVAEFSAAERVVAEILNDGSPVSIGVGLFDLVVGQSGKSLEQERADLVSP